MSDHTVQLLSTLSSRTCFRYRFNTWSSVRHACMFVKLFVTFYEMDVRVKVKQSRNIPVMAQRVPGSLGSQITMTFGTWSLWGCHPQKCSWYSFSLGAVSNPGPWYGRKECVTEESSDTKGKRSRESSTKWPQYVVEPCRSYIDYNIIYFHICINICWLFLIQSLVFVFTKLETENKDFYWFEAVHK